jgi:hypothetical protein
MRRAIPVAPPISRSSGPRRQKRDHAVARTVTDAMKAEQDVQGRDGRGWSRSRMLGELRTMVTLLRASGGHATEPTPQPTLAELRKLVESSGTQAQLTGELPPAVGISPPRRSSLPLPGSQQGLVGLRDRADILHGIVEAGPTAQGGYRVRLRMPLSED